MNRRPLSLLAATTLALAAILPTALPAAARLPISARPHAKVMAYWTPARIASAIPMDIRFGGHRAQVARRVTVAARPAPTAAPTFKAVTGASWTKGGLALTATGTVFFTSGTSNYRCSAAVISDGETTSARSIVLTAAHCAYDNTTSVKKFYTNWLFVPEYDSKPGSDPCGTSTVSTTDDSKWGCWAASRIVVDSAYAGAGTSTGGLTLTALQHDWAFVQVGLGGFAGGKLDATVGSFPIAYPSIKTGDVVYAFGYPGLDYQDQLLPNPGADLIYCAGTTITDRNTSRTTWGVGCSMGAGSSGGPWFGSFNEATGSGTVTSLNSYGYRSDKTMYGPMFNANTSKTFDASLIATGNAIVTVP